MKIASKFKTIIDTAVPDGYTMDYKTDQFQRVCAYLISQQGDFFSVLMRQYTNVSYEDSFNWLMECTNKFREHPR